MQLLIKFKQEKHAVAWLVLSVWLAYSMGALWGVGQ
jgi:hypothetical protein